jgi:hypothetical protein
MTTASSQPRYERKLIAVGLVAAEAVALVRRHPAMFRETFPERAVNNLYLDTPDLRHYTDHVNGSANRLKVRIRWYGEFGGRIERPVMEFKTKRGLVSSKAAHPLRPMTVNGSWPQETFQAVLKQSALPDAATLHLHGLAPALANHYRRRYFCSASGIRLTLDWALRFYDARHSSRWQAVAPHGGPGVIIELKYDLAKAEEAARITNAFPFRLTRCSKYVLGIQCLNAV